MIAPSLLTGSFPVRKPHPPLLHKTRMLHQLHRRSVMSAAYTQLVLTITQPGRPSGRALAQLPSSPITPRSAKRVAKDLSAGKMTCAKAYHKMRKGFLNASAQLALSKKQVSDLKNALKHNDQKKRKAWLLHPTHVAGRVAFLGPAEFEAARAIREAEEAAALEAAAQKQAAAAARSLEKAAQLAAKEARREEAQMKRELKKAEAAERKDAQREAQEARQKQRADKALERQAQLQAKRDARALKKTSKVVQKDDVAQVPEIASGVTTVPSDPHGDSLSPPMRSSDPFEDVDMDTSDVPGNLVLFGRLMETICDGTSEGSDDSDDCYQ